MNHLDARTRFDDPGTGRRHVLGDPVVFLAATVATVLILTASLCGVMVCALASDGLGRIASSTELMAVIKTGIASDRVAALQTRLGTMPGVSDIRLTSLTMLAAEQTGSTVPGSGPTVLRVRPMNDVVSLQGWASSLRRELADSPLVERVRVDEVWMARADRWLEMSRSARPWLVGIACLLVALATASVWYLATAALVARQGKAGAYLVVIAVAIATAACAVLLVGGDWSLDDRVFVRLAWQRWAECAGLVAAALLPALVANALARR